ncbi:MAG: glycosyl hydrolase 115 family protein, partial [Spirochaetales bacterium]|nr:glycosyl hydrolase 115 family protein [Spirochaetales bacterium]
ESTVSIGMRGDGDEAMSNETAIPLLERIISDQRKIIEEVTGGPASKTPQVWTLYKEVQDYWDQGMRVPDDVTVILSDDNWGNLRKLPLPGEKIHDGGYGIYYHFDYVGGPRSYRWINTNQIERVWEQMDLAWKYHARKLWIVNVGDIKPMEFPTEFFLDFAWDPEAIAAGDLAAWSTQWAQEQFGKQYAGEIAQIMDLYSKYNSRRKPELLEPETWSLLNYREAECVLRDFKDLQKRAEAVLNELPSVYLSSFTQLVLYPVEACTNLCEMYIAAGRNRLYEKYGFSEANQQADLVQLAFEKDAQLTDEYHSLLDGRWDHMMDQKKIGYTGWNEPKNEVMPEVKRVKVKDRAAMGIIAEGCEKIAPQDGLALNLPSFDPLHKQSFYIDLFNLGNPAYDYTAGSDSDWIVIDRPAGNVKTTARLSVSCDWNKAPKEDAGAVITITGAGKSATIAVKTDRSSWSGLGRFSGFIEDNGYISVNAEHYSRIVNGGGWEISTVSNLGRDDSAVRFFPKSGKYGELSAGSPYLEYPVFLNKGGAITVWNYLSPDLDFHNSGGLRFAVSLDDQKPVIVNMHSPFNWATAVKDNIQKVQTILTVSEAGAHVLKIWAIDPGVVLQKIIIDTGGLKESYLGPPQSLLLQ